MIIGEINIFKRFLLIIFFESLKEKYIIKGKGMFSLNLKMEFFFFVLKVVRLVLRLIFKFYLNVCVVRWIMRLLGFDF